MDQPGGITFLLFVEPICLKDGAEEVTFKFLLTETVLLFLILVHRFYIDFFTFEFPLNKISISALPGKIKLSKSKEDARWKVYFFGAIETYDLQQLGTSICPSNY